jgi:quinol monooxygenase YgiN
MKSYNNMLDIYTLGIWMVKSGRAENFIKEWTLFARWTSNHFPSAGKAHLLRDEKDSLRFISFGSWEDEESIQKWRSSKNFNDFAIKIKDLCQDFQPNTLRVVSTTAK